MVVSNKYTLRYNGTDLTYGNGFLVVNWSGGGINDVVAATPYGSGDGSYISKYRAADRQIIINIRVFRQSQKRAVQLLFGQRKSGTLTYIPDNNEDEAKEIDCVLVSAEPNGSVFPMDIPVTLLCPYPLWRGKARHLEQICGTVNSWTFPWKFPSKKDFVFSRSKSGNSVIFEYDGTLPTGFVTVIKTKQALSYVKLIDFYTKEQLYIGYSFPEGSEIIIDTQSGSKGAKWKSGRSGLDYTDISDCIEWGSTYLTINSGRNRIQISTSVGTNGIDAYIEYTSKAGGV